MKIELRVLSEEERAAADAAAASWREIEDEHERQVAACPGHEWEMTLFVPEDEEYVSLACTRCPASTYDALGDCLDLVYAEFEDGIKVVDGKSNVPIPMIVPVTVVLRGYSYWTDCGMEYDVEIEIEQRGPSRPLDG